MAEDGHDHDGPVDRGSDDGGPGDGTPERDDGEPETGSRPEVGDAPLGGDTDLSTAAAHLYRGEMDRVVTWRERLDQTTNWAVTVMAAILTFAFSSEDNPHYVLLIGMVLVAIFLGIETRRFVGYDVWRSRVRLLQENLFATILDPSQGVEREDWRRLLSEDYHDPSVNLPLIVGLAHRLRRVYLPLLLVLLAAWLFRITAFDRDQSVFETAAIGSVPGGIVVAVVALAFVAACAIVVWPRFAADGEDDEGEFTGVDAEWKDSKWRP